MKKGNRKGREGEKNLFGSTKDKDRAMTMRIPEKISRCLRNLR